MGYILFSGSRNHWVFRPRGDFRVRTIKDKTIRSVGDKRMGTELAEFFGKKNNARVNKIVKMILLMRANFCTVDFLARETESTREEIKSELRKLKRAYGPQLRSVLHKSQLTGRREVHHTLRVQG